MIHHQLLNDLRRLGVTIQVEGEKIRCRAIKGTVTPSLYQQLAARKNEIIEMLGGKPIISSTEALGQLPENRSSPPGSHIERSTDQVLIETVSWLCYRDCQGRFFHQDRTTTQTTELKTRQDSNSDALPPEWFDAFGRLLGLILLDRMREAEAREQLATLK
ncbi:MAG: hypothetical protein FJW35_06195 [Acidobacteria bacterium]|nr:hypothetical protein [Acidobacteriota bacterium]